MRAKYKSKEWLYDKYWKEGLSQRVLARLSGCAQPTIRYWMKHHGIKSKGTGCHRKYKVNTDFFKRWSPDMSWVLGYLFADGCIKRYDTVGMCSKDRDILETVAHIMEYDNSPKITHNGHTDTVYYYLDIYRREIVEDLSRYGVYPKKSLTMEFPSIPDEYFWDFVRGYFDGDGSVGTIRGKYLYVNFASGSLSFLNGLNTAGRRFGLSLRNIRHYKCYILDYCNRSDVYNIYKGMYHGKDVPCLHRKRKRFIDHFGG